MVSVELGRRRVARNRVPSERRAFARAKLTASGVLALQGVLGGGGEWIDTLTRSEADLVLGPCQCQLCSWLDVEEDRIHTPRGKWGFCSCNV